ncbi:MAG: hypothetical protein ACREN7_00245 [Candidatus Dormibacteria bacterium]
MPKSPFTSGPLDPLQDLGRPVLIITQSGAVAPTVYGVLGLERIPLMGKHGFIPLMLPSAGVLAGYQAYGGEGVFPLNAGSVGPGIQSNAFQLSPMTLLQCRPLLRGVGTITTDLAMDDIDLSISYPAANQHWQLQNVGGVMNMISQYALASDSTLGPAQGSDQTAPTANPGIDAFDRAFYNEFMVFGQQLPSFQFTNNGSVAIPSGASFMLGLNISAIRYDLTPWKGPASENIVHTYGEFTVQAPADAVAVPVSAFPPLSRGSAVS